ncbi:hypothetical protein [Nitrosopumilus sp.]|uniref:hypothetical protein n=1 Tax=Nitrosopumilus sp. TaxID=2024843 RepID=UPI00260937CE|nr:hypothetical protein [Nitrosopumilus sp.]
MSKFTVGLNLAWIGRDYDHDIGTNMTRDHDNGNHIAVPYDSAETEKIISDISGMGVKVVRFWLFERFEGLSFGPTGEVLGITTDFWHNLRDMCSIAKRYDVKFYFCLMDTWALTDSGVADFRDHYAAMINGIITTPPKRQSFLNAVFEILNDSVVKETVWAVDVLNEPEGIEHEKILGDRGVATNVHWDQVIQYINDACLQIRQNTGHRVSCGFQESKHVKRFRDDISDAVDFFDFHRYDDAGSLPSLDDLELSKDCMIGECGQSTEEVKPELQRRCIESFLQNAKRLGYFACMPWRYGYSGYTDDWDRWNFVLNADGTHRPVVDIISNFGEE